MKYSDLFKRRGKFLLESIHHIMNNTKGDVSQELENFKKLKEVERIENIVYKKENIKKRQISEEYYMSILACERMETNLTLVDLFIKFRDLVDKDLKNNINNTIYKKYCSVGNGVMDNSNNEMNKLYFDTVIETQELSKYFNGIMNRTNHLISLSNTSSKITKKDSYNGLIKKKELYKKIMNEIDMLEAFINEMSTKFKKIIHSLVPFTIYLETVRRSLLKLIKLNEANISKLDNRYGILLNKDELIALCKIFTQERVTLGLNILNKIRNLMPQSMREFLKKYTIKSLKKKKKVVINIDKRSREKIVNEIVNS